MRLPFYQTNAVDTCSDVKRWWDGEITISATEPRTEWAIYFTRNELLEGPWHSPQSPHVSVPLPETLTEKCRLYFSTPF